MYSLYIVKTNLLLVAHLQIFFFPFWGLSFHFVYGFLFCARFLSLIRSHLFMFVFIFIILGGGSKKILLQFMSKSVLPMLSSKSLMVSGLTFRSLIHSELSFVCGIRECSNLILLHIAVQFFQHHLLKRLFSLHCIVFPFILVGGMDLFLHLLSCLIDLDFCFCAGTNPYWIIVAL